MPGTARLATLLEKLRSSYWFVPSLMTVAAVITAVLCLKSDQARGYKPIENAWFVFGGGADGARAVLSAIASSVITVAGTTFSVTIASFSMTAAQFGPRLLRSFLRDRGNQIVLGTFTGTFLYCLLVLRTVRGGDNDTIVPHISVTVGVGLAILSLSVLIFFIHHATQSIQVAHVVDLTASELEGAIRRLFPKRQGQPAPTPPAGSKRGEPVRADTSGYVEAIEAEALLKIAAERDLTLTVISRPGDYVIAGMPLLLVDPPADESCASRICNAFALGRRRTPQQDAVFAFLQMADIALRALSPSLNDPLTANMCLDRITSAVCLLGQRSLPEPVRTSESRRGRLIAYPYKYSDLIEAAYHHIAQAAQEQPMVRRHCRTCMQLALERAAPAELVEALENELERLDRESWISEWSGQGNAR